MYSEVSVYESVRSRKFSISLFPHAFYAGVPISQRKNINSERVFSAWYEQRDAKHVSEYD